MRLLENKWKTVSKYLPIILCGVIILLYFVFGGDITSETIINYAPANPYLAALFLILLYGVKSLSIFFPVIVLYIAGGFLFPPYVAILINLVGIIVEFIIPYFIGKRTGAEKLTELSNKHKTLAEITMHIKNNNFFISFFLRIVSALPGDVVSIYLGAKNIPFGTYLVGSVLGTMPGLITSTLIGTSITNPASPMFWVNASLTVLLSVGSCTIYYIWYRKKKKQRM